MKPFTLPEEDAPPRSRPGWVRDRILRFDQRWEPRFRREKFLHMSKGPLSFFRGTNHLFWADLGESPLLEDFGGKGTRPWICGDAHLGNFGSFTDATGRLVYDLNDFDESVIADYQLDLWRLAVSLVLAAGEIKKSRKEAGRWAVECARGYWKELKSCRWYGNIRHAPWDEEQSYGSLRHFLGRVRKEGGFPAMMARWTRAGRDGVRFDTKGNRELEPVPDDIAGKLERGLEKYAKSLRPWPAGRPRIFEVEDLARRLGAGIGSQGHPRYYALVRVRESGEGARRILDIKEEMEPSGWDLLRKKTRKAIRKKCGDNQALRAERAYQALVRHPDPWQGSLELKGGDYLIRERSPFKDSLPLDKLDENAATQLGAILARCHCRAEDPFAKRAFERIREDKKGFRKTVARIALAYADQVEEDFRAFKGGKWD